MNEFDIKAASWDDNPMHWDRSEAIAKGIQNYIPLNKKMNALEYGAGTGITSFLLKDKLKKITLMDNSAEMINVLTEKIVSGKVKNTKAVLFDLEHADYTEEKFDLIITQMALHHIADIETIIVRFGKLLKSGGYLAIADLYPEDGSFHGEGFSGHRGFDPENLIRILKNNNFQNAFHFKCFTTVKKTSDNKTKEFDVFLLISTRT